MATFLTENALSNLYLNESTTGISLHGCSRKAQLLLLTLGEWYLLTTAPTPDLEHGIAPLGPPAPIQSKVRGSGCTLLEQP